MELSEWPVAATALESRDSSMISRLRSSEGSVDPVQIIDFSQWIPVFPLPNAVLLPGAVLPLHIFEPRYREMTRDALGGQRVMALALLKPNYEEKYHTLEAELHDDVCVGRILREEMLPDGRYNFLLQGVIRGRIHQENRALAYRRAVIQPIYPIPVQPAREMELRQALRALLERPPLDEVADRCHWLELFNCEGLGLSDLLDLLASGVLSDPEARQLFLANPCVEARAACLQRILAALSEQAASAARPHRPRPWPPPCGTN